MISRDTAVAFNVVWEQGERNLGAFRTVISKEKLEVSLSKRAAPKADPRKVLTLQFLKDTPQSTIDAFLEKHELRLLRKDWTGFYEVAVTGKTKAGQFARSVSGLGSVFYASTKNAEAKESKQLRITVRGDTAQQDIAKLLRKHNLRVLERDRDGINFRVAVAGNTSAQKMAARLTSRGIVYFAHPVQSNIAEDREVIIQFTKGTFGGNATKAATEAEIARALRRGKLQVIEDLGDGTFKVAAVRNTPGVKLAKSLIKFKHIVSAVPIGAATDEDVKSAARSAASYKGRPWSSTEYNMHYHYIHVALVLKGATKAQLAEFARLASEAPIKGGSFNPWSGD
jgi:hypothetical protein